MLLQCAASFRGDSDPLHSLSNGSSVAGRLSELVDFCKCGSGVGGELDSIRSLANLVLVVGIGDPSGEESASGVCFSRLLDMDPHEEDAGERHSRGEPHITSRLPCGAAVLLLGRVGMSAMSNIGNRAAPGDLAGNRGDVRLTSDRISPQKWSGVVASAHVNDC